ncbi:MAG: IS30 family transposase, partial [Alloscardovia omnicolens]|nr:IS30 family transposase [Alloscardovia omnicolens]
MHKNTNEDGQYNPYHAHQLRHSRLARPKTCKIDYPPLKRLVASLLAKHWSPDQISGWLKKTYPHDTLMHMSVETIYQTIYVQAKGKLKKNITHLLRSGRTQRKPLTTRAKRPRFREPMVMISDRPASVNDRAIPKHWEGDLITGRNNKSAIGTLV